ncbi:unnamed protein product, partial [Didymodactylos carnosus]
MEANAKLQIECNNVLSLKDINDKLRLENDMIRLEITELQNHRLPVAPEAVRQYFKTVLKHIKFTEEQSTGPAAACSQLLPLTAEEVKMCFDPESWSTTTRNLVKKCYTTIDFDNDKTSYIELLKINKTMM